MKKIVVLLLIICFICGCENEKPKVPSGFSYKEGSLQEGYVIVDKDDNEFVWVPVDSLSRYDFLHDEYHDDEEIERIYYGEGVKESILYASSYNIDEFKKSVAKYGGFYVSRYEIADSSANNPRTAPADGVAVSKPGYYPYNFVTRDEAFKISTDFCNNKQIKSSLINSYAWDSMMFYIGYNDIDLKGDNQLHKTGQGNDIVKNIYDLGGNVSEWTSEYSSSAYYHFKDDCVYRANNNQNSDLEYTKRHYNSNVSNEFIGFRIVLYFSMGE